jgi:hypothetical protein
VSARRPSEHGAERHVAIGVARGGGEGGRVSARRPSEHGAEGAARTGAFRGGARERTPIQEKGA